MRARLSMTLTDFQKFRQRNKPAFAALLEVLGVIEGGRIGWTETAWDNAATEHAPQYVIRKSKLIQEVPKDKWPAWVRLIAIASRQEDRGVGDTAARLISKIGGERYKAWRAKVGSPCGCDERQEDLNCAYPYRQNALTAAEGLPKVNHAA